MCRHVGAQDDLVLGLHRLGIVSLRCLSGRGLLLFRGKSRLGSDWWHDWWRAPAALASGALVRIDLSRSPETLSDDPILTFLLMLLPITMNMATRIAAM